MPHSRLFQIVTLVTKPTVYEHMRASMAAQGFDDDRCRFTLLDNFNGNQFEPYSVLRDLPSTGDEPYLILCHQDLEFNAETSCEILINRIKQLDRVDPTWAVAGIAGMTARAEYVLHLDDPGGHFRAQDLPRKVISLDECFLLFDRRRFPGVSAGLSGFHFYGTDVCFNAMFNGHGCHVIAFPLTHFGKGDFGADFKRMQIEFSNLWRPYFAVCIIRTTCAHLKISRFAWLEKRFAQGRLVSFFQSKRWNVVPFPGLRWMRQRFQRR